MGALDRLSGFSAKSATPPSDNVFDTKTPAGAFLQSVHNAGYKMYEPCYTLKEEFRIDESTLSESELEQYQAMLEITEEAYNMFNDNVRALYEKSFRHTELHNVLTTDGNQIVNAVAGSGKALVNGTRVLTATGYRAIETLHVGDKVFGEDGKLHNVQGVFPQGLEQVYEVLFSDGHKILCSGNHLWEVEDLSRGDDKPPKVLTTEDILSTVPLKWLDRQYSCRVPVVRALDYEVTPVCSINPYIMGYLLLAMSCGSDDSVFVNAKHKNSLTKFFQLASSQFGAVCVKSDDSGCTYRLDSKTLVSQLAGLGVYGRDQYEMFVPQEYLRTSKTLRVWLLRGILDAGFDLFGCTDALLLKSKRLTDDIELLCESLGLVVVVTNNGEESCLTICTDGFREILYSDKTAAEICQDISCVAERYIVSITKLDERKPMTCIAVDSPRHLYVTEHCIVTHNTTMLVFKILYDIVTGRCMTLRELENGMTVRVANKVWVCTFLRSGAAELETALTNWQRKLGYSQTAPMLSFSTMDAEFKRCLNAMGVATPLDEGGKLYSCMVKAIDSCNIKRNGYNLSKEDYNIIGGIITYYRGRLDDKRYSHPSCQEYELTPTILDLVVKQFAQLRQQAGIMDFPEIMELLYKYLYVTPNAQVQEFVANRYNFIYIDEFQDTSQMAYAILKFYARGKLWMNRSGETAPADAPAGLYIGHETVGKLVVVGDTAQCVPADAKIRLESGEVVEAQNIGVGDKIQAIIGENVYGYVPVDEVISRRHVGNICRISLMNGKSVTVTDDHKCFVKDDGCGEPVDIELSMFGGQGIRSKVAIRYPDGEDGVYESDNVESLEELIRDAVTKYGYLGAIPTIRRVAVMASGERYRVVEAKDVIFGDIMCVYDEAHDVFVKDAVIGVDEVPYDGLVYDFNIGRVRNFIADDVVVHNCIYSFRGSDSNILATEVAEDFRPVISALSVNWRCPNVILDPVVPSIHRNWDSVDQDIRAANKGGELFAYAFKNYNQMIQQLKADIQQDMDDGMRVAILCRTNFDGLIPAIVLEQDGRFNFSVSGENMTMSSPLPKKLIGMTSLFTERATAAVKNSLSEFAGKSNSWAVKQLIDTMKMNGKSFWDIAEADIRYSCPVLLDFYKDIRPLIYANGVRDKAAEVDALRVVYHKLMNDVYWNDSAYCESARAYIETLLFILDRGNFKSVYEFLEEIDYLNDKLNGRIKKKKVYVQIATVHEFKGKEADSVYIWNDNDGTFPYSKCNMQVESEVNEERRVHYIACTRAKKREHIYSLAGKVGMFAREMDVKFVNPVPVAAKLPKKSALPEG